MAVSDKQREANIRNAQLSTGPKTQAGKYRSRRNAIRHGLTGSGAGLAEIARGEVEAEILVFERRLNPRDEIERRYVQQAALASVRHNRAQVQIEAATQGRCRRAESDWDERRRAEVDAALGRLRNEPAAALPILWRTAEGCDALCDAWADLGRLLDEEGGWGPVAAAKALALLGYNRPPDDDAPAEAREFALAVKAISGALDFTDRMRLRRGKPLEGPDPEEAYEVLHAMIEQRIARLSALADENWQTFDAPARAAAVSAALVDNSPEGQRLVQYQSRAAREMQQAIRGLFAYRKEQDRARKDAPDPEPLPQQNEPISPTATQPQCPTHEQVNSHSPSPAPAPAPPPIRVEIASDAPPSPSAPPLGDADRPEIDRPIPIR